MEEEDPRLQPFGHLLSLSKLPPSLRATDKVLSWVRARSASTAGLSVLWYKDNHAILVLPNAVQGTHVMRALQEAATGEPLVAPMTLALAKAFESGGESLPGSQRPETDTKVASRLIRGALGSSRARARDASSATPAVSQEAYLRPVAPLTAASSRADSDRDWRATVRRDSGRAAAAAVADNDCDCVSSRGGCTCTERCVCSLSCTCACVRNAAWGAPSHGRHTGGAAAPAPVAASLQGDAWGDDDADVPAAEPKPVEVRVRGRGAVGSGPAARMISRALHDAVGASPAPASSHGVHYV